jgi:hypothetical protein
LASRNLTADFRDVVFPRVEMGALLLLLSLLLLGIDQDAHHQTKLGFLISGEDHDGLSTCFANGALR